MFGYHVEVLKAIQATVVKEKVGHMMIIGETPPLERHASVKRFQEDDDCRVAVLSLLACSQGITLTATSTVVFAELHWTPGLIEQAEDRAHRIGQRSAVNVHFLVAAKTLDDMLWHTLSRKVTVVSHALDGAQAHLRADKVDVEAGKRQVTCARCGGLVGGGGSEGEHAGGLCKCIQAGSAEMLEVAREWQDASPRAHTRPSAVGLMAFFGGGDGKAAEAKRRSSGAGRAQDLEKWGCKECTFINDPSQAKGLSDEHLISSHADVDQSSLYHTLTHTQLPPTPFCTTAGSALGVRMCAMCNSTRVRGGAAAGGTAAAVAAAASPTITTATSTTTPEGMEVLARTPASQQLQYLVSSNTGRLWLYSSSGENLHQNVKFSQVLEGGSGLPAKLASARALDEARRFVRVGVLCVRV